MKFSWKEMLNGNEETSINKEAINNLKILQEKLNKLGELYKPSAILTSSYRDASKNKEVGGVTKSAHCLGMAADINDKDGKLALFLLNNIDRVKELGLYIENPLRTHLTVKSGSVYNVIAGWCHIQTRKASQTIFEP